MKWQIITQFRKAFKNDYEAIKSLYLITTRGLNDHKLVFMSNEKF